MGMWKVVGRLLARYLQAVWNTSDISVCPPDGLLGIKKMTPCIITAWHGQHFMTPFALPNDKRFRALIAHGAFGSIYMHAFSQLGITVIRGAAGPPKKMHRNGGYAATRKLLDALQSGESIGITADIPKIARRAGPGIVALGRHSGRPIVPLAVVTSRRFILAFRWDKLAIHLPYSRIAVVVGDPIFVSANIDDSYVEIKRREIEDALNAANAHAHTVLASRN